MPKIAISFLFCILVSSSFAKLNHPNVSIHFQSGSYELSPASIHTLDSLIRSIDPDDDYEIFLEGHTDNIGSLGFNDSLSSKRTLSVKKHLMNRGVDSDLLYCSSSGERKPQKPNTTEFNKQSNRRVTVRLKRYVFNSVEELDQALKNPDNHYQLDPKKANTLRGKKGVKIQIPSNAFILVDGTTVEEDVKITLTEAIGMESFISQNLATLSDGKLIESGGMLKLSAQTLSGKEVFIDSTKKLEVKVPYQNFEKGMEVFLSDQGDNWTPTGDAVETDEIDLNSLRPIVDLSKLRYFKVPNFKRDLATKPKPPVILNKPKPPRRSDKTRYFKALKWYQWPVKAIIEKRQNEAYATSLSQYEKRHMKYKERKERYERFSEEYQTKTIAYYKALKTWDDKQKTDSLNFKNTKPYKNAISMNKKIREAIRDRQEIADREWKRRIDSVMSSLSDSSVLNSGLLNSYVMHTSELSWINIDRFLKYKPSDLRPLAFKDPDTTSEKAYVVFDDLKCLLPLYRTDSKGKAQYKIDGIPKREKAKLLVYKVVDGKAMVYMENISGKPKSYIPRYEHYKLSEFRKLLKELNG